jgi:hypothetical protein
MANRAVHLARHSTPAWHRCRQVHQVGARMIYDKRDPLLQLEDDRKMIAACLIAAIALVSLLFVVLVR